MVKYTRLWETMKEKKVSQYRLIKYYGIRETVSEEEPKESTGRNEKDEQEKNQP